MSHALPANPLPLPTKAEQNCCPTNTPTKIAKNTSITSDECAWARYYPDLQKGCFFSRVCQYAAPKKCQFFDIPSILQRGPTCGLTALSMLMGQQAAITTAQLLTEAMELGYSLNGEMFSAHYLYKLACKHLLNSHIGNCQLYEGQLNCAKIKELLQNNGCMLVPYPF